MKNHIALFWKEREGGLVECGLCRHRCNIQIDGYGVCRVRKNKEGKLITLNYGKPISLGVDPVEKKPLYHFLPGSLSFSIATSGCNFKCPWCQNWSISQREVDETTPFVSPEAIIESAVNAECKSISYTYTEPTVFFEYAIDCAKIAKEKGIKNIFVTNGYMTREAIDLASPYLNAANIDLKSFDKETYKKRVGASLDGVCDSIVHMYESGIWIEITTLIIPNVNDGKDELKLIAEFIASIDKSIPWHISRFFPQYKETNGEITSEGKLKEAYDIGKESGLKHIYVGNIQGFGYENTLCDKCSNVLIERNGYRIENKLISNDTCPDCGNKAKGIY